jgi:hypothetical protein
MINQQAWLIRYQVMAQLRIHFSQLFFWVVFAIIITAFATVFTGQLLLKISVAYICFTLAANFALGTVVAHRLLMRERACFTEMQAAWVGAQSQEYDKKALHRWGRGAMDLILFALAILSLIFGILGAVY